MWNDVDKYCFLSKQIYNEGNFLIRKKFLETGLWMRYQESDKIMRNSDFYYLLGSQPSQMVLRLIDKNWSSFFKSIKTWSSNKGSGYLGKPGLPDYKKENGRCLLMLTNNLFKIRNGEIYFSWKPLNIYSGIKTNVSGKTLQIRFVPSGSCYYMEIVYETEILEKQPIKNIIGIDLGVNNFATVSNNIGVTPIIINGKSIKSMNQYWNKSRSKIRKETGKGWCNKIQRITDKHREKLDYFMHVASRRIIDFCLEYGIDTIVIGKNDGWKQDVNMGKRNNQTFVYIPYEKFITKLKYKAENYGINFIETEESYTSGTSFLDGELPIKQNYNKSRRISRGMFRSNKGILINADLNGSYQIVRKVFPNAFEQWDRGCGLHPVRWNI